MKKLAVLSSPALAAGLLALLACNPAATTEKVPEPVELHAYEVPFAYKSDIMGQLRYVLGGTEETLIGRVHEGPGNTVLVVAPESIHDGVRELMRELEGMGESPPSPSLLHLTYWIVVGRPLKPSAAEGPFVVNGPAKLDAVEPALVGIADAQGPTEFRLLERLELSSIGPEWASASGRFARVRHRTAMSEGKVVADLNLSLHNCPNSLDTRVTLEPGHFLVLGQAGYAGRPMDAFGTNDASDVTLYYVLTSDR